MTSDLPGGVSRNVFLPRMVSIENVSGILGNVICTLAEIEWQPIAYNVWADPLGNLWVLEPGGAAKHIVINAIIDDCSLLYLVSASKHYCGDGIQKGICWHSTLQLLATYKKDKSLIEVAVLETFLSAACWPAARVFEMFFGLY